MRNVIYKGWAKWQQTCHLSTHDYLSSKLLNFKSWSNDLPFDLISLPSRLSASPLCQLVASGPADPYNPLYLQSPTPCRLLSLPLTWLEFLWWPLGSDDSDIFYLSAFVSPNIQQLWSMATLQFSGSRWDSSARKKKIKGVSATAALMERRVCVSVRVCVGWKWGVMEKGKNREGKRKK